MENFATYSKYYDLLYKEKDYHSETEYINALIHKYSPGSTSILELGSGTGKHARLLANLGYTVHGIERSYEMVKIANQIPAENVTYEINDISSFNSSGTFEVAISLFHVISYLTGNNDLLTTFKKVGSSLKPAGFFIFDVWYSPAVYFQRPETRIKRLTNGEIMVTRLAEPVIHFRTNVIDVNYEIVIEDKNGDSFQRLSEKHPMRHFSEPEISLIANASGFNVIHSEEFLTGNPPSQNTWGVCFILQKVN